MKFRFAFAGGALALLAFLSGPIDAQSKTAKPVPLPTPCPRRSSSSAAPSARLAS